MDMESNEKQAGGTRLTEDQRLEMHSGDYVALLQSVPISRMTRLVPLMQLGPGTRLVDFASGTGVFSALVQDQVASYEGVDFSPDFVAAARKLAEEAGVTNATFHCQDIVEFCSSREGEFDVVTANDFSEHVYDEDFARIFSGAYKILKPGGHLYIYTPNKDFFWEWMKDVGLAKQFPQHIGVRNAAEYLPLLERCGFKRENVEIDYLPHFNILKVLHPLSQVPLIGRFFRAKLFIRCRK